MKIFISIIIILLFSISFLNAKNPKVFIEYENGDRYIPEDSDYSDMDYKDYLSYKYDIYKLGVSQFLPNNKSYSIIYKVIDKDYNQPIESGSSSDNNKTNSLSAYYKFKLVKIFSFTFQTIYRKRDYEESHSTKESKWIANSMTLTCKPDYDNFFINDKNEYNFNIRYKDTNYKYAPDKDSKDISYYVSWNRDFTENLNFELRYKVTQMDFEQENYLRIDSEKNSLLARLEYQF